jgi:hypothetical protein
MEYAARFQLEGLRKLEPRLKAFEVIVEFCHELLTNS